MIVNNNHIILIEFLQSQSQREWLYFPHLQVYLRKSKRVNPLVRGQLISCLDIANVTVSEGMRGRGVFKSWLDDVVELSTGFDAIYVENVQTRTFARYFERREEWLLVSQPDQGVKPCFLRLLEEDTPMKTDKKAPPMAPDKLLAKCILKASEIREQSFDHAAANASSIQADKDRSKNSNNVYSGITDFRRFYRKTIAESCEEACSNTGLSAILHILLDNSWNESINWAKDTLA